MISIPFTGTVDKAGHSGACTVCLPTAPDAPRPEAAEPGAQREAAVPDAEEAVAARGAQPVAAVEAPGARLAAEPGAPSAEAEPGEQPAAVAQGEQPRAAARPALQPSSESAALRVPTMVQEAAKILCRRLGLAVLST